MIALPRIVQYGGGSIKGLGELMARMGYKRPLVVADPFLKSTASGAVASVSAALATHVSHFDVFADTITDPTTDSVEYAVWDSNTVH